MKNRKLPLQILYTGLFFFMATLQLSMIAQSSCTAPKNHGSGFSTLISTVDENEDGSFTIVLLLRNNGCTEPECKPINQYFIEADPGTYTDISWTLNDGEERYDGIVLGPKLGGWNKKGFKISAVNGLGDGNAGTITVTYTLSYLQDQWIMVKAGSNRLEVFFSEEEFNYVLDCKLGGYIALPAGAKETTPGNKIGPFLTSLSRLEGIPRSNDMYRIVFDQDSDTYFVIVEITPVTGQYNSLLNELVNDFGLREVIPDSDELIIRGEIPVSELSNLNDLDNLASAAPGYPPQNNSGLLATSQGDTSMLSYIARDIFSVLQSDDTRRAINGEGVKVGVISNSYNTRTNPENQANNDVLQFELPGIGIKSDGTEIPNPLNDTDVNVLKEYPYGEASDEGRAMMQIIHDVAPGADLVFRTGILGAKDMSDAINELVAADCDVLVDDVTYITEPFFEDGVISQTVDQVVEVNDIAYFTSAGNFGDRSYTAIYNPATDGLSNISGTPHVFGTNESGEDVLQNFTANVPADAPVPQFLTIVLQWEDNDPTSTFNNTKTDMDIYLITEGGGIIGYNTVNIGQKAVEVLPIFLTETTNADIVVAKASDNDVEVRFKYVVFKGLVDINEYEAGEATIVGHANSVGAMTVGAIRYDNTPAYGGEFQIMSFSSIGGLTINDVDRNKPDFTAPNGVNTTLDLGNGDFDQDPDELPNFFGTSASAPHAAAVAALLIDAKTSWHGTSISPAEVRSTMISTAIGTESYDPVFGNGFIQADASLLTLGNPAPILDSFIIDDEGTPGHAPVSVIFFGRYFTEDTKIVFNGHELHTTVDLEAGTLTATIPVFTEAYPPIIAHNPPTAPLENDGGTSNTLYFEEKPTIVGTLEDQMKFYGENMPEVAFTLSFEVNGVTCNLDEAGLSEAQMERIMEVLPINNADELSDIGIWPYYISLDEVLNPLYKGPPPPAHSVEASLLNNFNFRFDLGALEILKLDLTIRPDDATFSFGEPISGFTYTFTYDNSNIDPLIEQILQDSVLLAYQGDLATDVTALVDTALYLADSMGGVVPNSYFMSENAYDEAVENGQSLALVNGKSLALVNGQSLALVNGQSLALVNKQALALVNGKSLALVNVEALVNGQALALVNTEASTNGLSLALVNAQSLALVNNPDPLWDEAFLNGQALALVNTAALTNGQSLALVNEGGGLVNGQSLALVNSATFNDVNNKDAILILTVDDIRTLLEAGSPNSIELLSINTISGNTVTTNEDPHKIASGAFIASNFNMKYELGDLFIEKAELEVFGNSQVIDEGMAAPEYSFTYNGFIAPDDELSVFGTDGADYSIIDLEDESLYNEESSGPGEYVITIPDTDNYTVVFPSTISLFVNPDDLNTKAVRPKLECVADEGDGIYTAYFYYKNNNEDPVWIFVGPDNIVTGGGDPDISQQPVKFEPGGGAWEATFDGSPLRWKVTSNHKGDRKTIRRTAKAGSTSCEKSDFAGLVEEEGIRVFPNPTSDRVTISAGVGQSIGEVAVYNFLGRSVSAPLIHISEQVVEVYLGELPQGIYIITIKTGDGFETFKVIKQ